MSAMSSSTSTATPMATPAASHPYTCNTCQVAFRTSESQRSHMQTDWHRYNLKRRVASLPPLESEVFAEKVLANQASAAATAARASFERFCPLCQKRFFSENAYQNHLGSQKHRARLAATQSATAAAKDDDTTSVMSSTFSLGEPVDTPRKVADPEAQEEFSRVVNGIQKTSVNDEEPVPQRPSRPPVSAAGEREAHPLSPTKDITNVPLTEEAADEFSILRCLFCNYESPSLPLNIDHMSVMHGMFVPEKDYLVNLEGLLHYLYDKITGLHECLYCGLVKHTVSGIRTHMRDKGHCMIAFENEEDMIEVGQYYDFSSTYSDNEDDDSDTTDGEAKGGVKLGARRSEAIVVEADNGAPQVDDDDEGWESGSTLSSIPAEELGSVPVDPRTDNDKTLNKNRHHSHRDPRPHHHSDGWQSHAHRTPHAVYYDEYEMHMPSGRVAGHRSLNKYFRQNLHGYPTPAERASRRAIMDDSASASNSNDEDAGEAQTGRGRQVITRANGGLGMFGVSDGKKREVRAVETRERKREQRARARYQWGNEKQANFQKHYRDPLLQ